jgi:putative peptidoglycan lipid II flippase
VWAAAFLASTQVLLGVVLVLANRVEGGVVQYQVAFTVFLLPHALFALPVLTALFPAMARHASAGDDVRYGRSVASGLGAIAFLVLAASAGLVALAEPVAETVRFAEFSEAGASRVAGALRAFAPGLLGYGAFLFLARAFYARGDTRTPAVVNAWVVALGASAMVAAVTIADERDAIAAIAGVHSAAYTAGALALLVLLARQRSILLHVVGRHVAAGVVASVCAAVAMWAITNALPGASRAGAAAEVVTGGAAGLVVYLAVGTLAGGPRPSTLPALLRGQGG